MSFSMDLYNWRTEQGLSQKQAGNWIGVSAVTIDNIEKNRVNPSKNTIAKFKKVTGISRDIDYDTKEAEQKTSTKEYKPFTERLAEAFPEKYAKYEAEQKETKLSARPAPIEESTHISTEASYLVGFFEGITVATKIDATEQLKKLRMMLSL